MNKNTSITDIQPNRIKKVANPLQIAGLIKVCIFSEDALDAQGPWQKFETLMDKIPSQKGKAACGICFDKNDGRGIEYVCGVEVAEGTKISDLPDELDLKQLPSFPYAVFDHTGHVSWILQTSDAIWKLWLPESGYKKPSHTGFLF